MFRRLVNTHLSLFGATLEEITQHVFHVYTHLFDALRSRQLDHWEVLFANFDFDEAAIKLATAQLLTKLLSSALKLILSGSVLRRFGSSLRAYFLICGGIEVVKTGGRTRRRQQHIEDSFL